MQYQRINVRKDSGALKKQADAARRGYQRKPAARAPALVWLAALLAATAFFGLLGYRVTGMADARPAITESRPATT